MDQFEEIMRHMNKCKTREYGSVSLITVKGEAKATLKMGSRTMQVEPYYDQNIMAWRTKLNDEECIYNNVNNLSHSLLSQGYGGYEKDAVMAIAEGAWPFFIQEKPILHLYLETEKMKVYSILLSPFWELSHAFLKFIPEGNDLRIEVHRYEVRPNPEPIYGIKIQSLKDLPNLERKALKLTQKVSDEYIERLNNELKALVEKHFLN